MSRSAIAILVGALALSLAGPGPAVAAIVIQAMDSPGEGFDDPTPAAPVGGNPGITVGQQRRVVFDEVAALWSATLRSPVDVLVSARFDPLPCTGTAAVLGSTGPTTAVRDFEGAPLPGTWYVIAAANALAGKDLLPDGPDMSARFSSSLGTAGCELHWYLGLDGAAPPGSIDLLSVALHEFAHGLGFVSLVDVQTGAKLLGADDSFSDRLLDQTTGRTFPEMSDSERAAACVKPEALHWIGPDVTAESADLSSGVGPGGRVHMYSPAALRVGSSVSHFSTSLAPNDLMEPFYTGPTRDLVRTHALLRDVGWPGGEAPAECIPSSTAFCSRGGRFRVEISWTDFSLQTSAAQVAEPRTGDSGLFYFYGPDNWEVLVKILDGCGENGNGHTWVFAAAATTLGYTIIVTDTVDGTVRRYSNPLGVSSPAITDTFAFSGCP